MVKEEIKKPEEKAQPKKTSNAQVAAQLTTAFAKDVFLPKEGAVFAGNRTIDEVVNQLLPTIEKANSQMAENIRKIYTDKHSYLIENQSYTGDTPIGSIDVPTPKGYGVPLCKVVIAQYQEKA